MVDRSLCLSIESLTLHISLGPKEEQAKQPIHIDLWIFFPRMPLACVSDEPQDAICYKACVDIIKRESHQKHFYLLEHLAYALHAALKKELPMSLEIGIKVSKLDTAIPEIKKAISFTYFPQKEPVEKKISRDWD